MLPMMFCLIKQSLSPRKAHPQSIYRIEENEPFSPADGISPKILEVLLKKRRPIIIYKPYRNKHSEKRIKCVSIFSPISVALSIFARQKDCSFYDFACVLENVLSLSSATGVSD